MKGAAADCHASQAHQGTAKTVADDDEELRQSFEQLLDNKQFSDLVFDIDGHEVYAHSNILVVRCPYFKGLYDHCLCTARGELRFPLLTQSFLKTRHPRKAQFSV